MKLDPLDGQPLVPKPHHFAIILGGRRDQESLRDRVAIGAQRVISDRLKRVRHPGKESLAIVFDRTRFSVPHQSRTVHCGSADVGDRLVPEANAKERHIEARPSFKRGPGDIQADARFAGSAGAWREKNSSRSQGRDALQVDLVVPTDDNLCPALPEVLDQVIGEAIEIVDDEDHGLSSVRARLLK